MNQIKKISFKLIGGMNQDNDPQSQSQDTAYRLFNIKTQSINNSTTNALVNEKGNTKIDLYDYNIWFDQSKQYKQAATIEGIVLGTIQCSFDTTVIFTYKNINDNRIYKLFYDEKEDVIFVKLLAQGNFNFRLTIDEENNKTSDVVISGLFIYENSELQKIYWVDGVNQLRFLNIADDNPLFKRNTEADTEAGRQGYIENAEFLNSHPSFKLGHKIYVTRVPGGGVFSPGVIQYAFTYYNKYGAETNVVDITPMYYIAEEDRGVAADQTIGCSYRVTIVDYDDSFDYLRLYSIQRNSLNGVPVVKIVNDFKLK